MGIHTDKVLPTYKPIGKPEHFTYKLAEFYNDTPTQTMIDMRRMVMTGDVKLTITSINIPGLGTVEDIPYMQLSLGSIMLIGDTWLAILDLYKKSVK